MEHILTYLIATYEFRTHFACFMRTASIKYQEIRSQTTDIAQLQQEDMAQAKFTAASNRYFLGWWHWDSIGAACVEDADAETIHQEENK